MTELRERFIETNGIKLHVMEAGPENGPMIMFLHGFPEFWYAWRKQISYFADKGYLVVVPDQRGYNLSDKPEGIEAYKADEMAKDAAGLIDFYGREQIYLAGHDWGASVSWWTALKYPERIKRLIIMNIPHPKIMNANLLSNPKQMQQSWYMFFFQLPNAPEKLAAANNYAWPLSVLAETSKPGTFTLEELEEYRQAYARPGAFPAMINWYRAMLQCRNQPPLSFRITMPLLILWGVGDVNIMQEQAEQSLSYCDQASLVKFDCTHWIQHEEPEQVNRMIADFISQD